MQAYDELRAYRGTAFDIEEGITVRQPTLGEICDYGEREYYQMVYTLTSVGADLKWQLDTAGIDYTKIDDYTLFYSILSKNYSTSQTSILFGDSLDFSSMELMMEKATEKVVMLQPDGTIFSKEAYDACIPCLRRMHGILRNDQVPANESTRRILIEDAREEYLLSKDKPYKSLLLPLISTMVNMPGFKRNDSSVWDMKIYAFMDSVKRISKIQNAGLLLQSGYSGFGVDLQKIDKKQLDYMGDLT